MKHSITLRRVLLTFSLLLTFIFGAPTAAKAADLPTAGHLTFTLCPGSTAIVFYSSSATAPAAGNIPTLITQLHGTASWPAPATISMDIPTVCATGAAALDALPVSGTVTSNVLTLLESNSLHQSFFQLTYSGLGIVVGSTQYSLITINSSPLLSSRGVYVVDYGAGGSGASAPVYTTAPMLPLPDSQPGVTIGSSVITCLLGNYSMAPVAAAFSLYLDGQHVETQLTESWNLPLWLLFWAPPETIIRTRFRASAQFELAESYIGKRVECRTIAFANGATGIATSKSSKIMDSDFDNIK